MIYSWDLRYDAKPMNLNFERRQAHWSVRRERTEEWRGAFKMLCKEQKVPRMHAIEVDVYQFWKSYEPDPVAGVPAFKAALDGIVDAGVIPDDKGKYVKRVSFWPPEKASHDGMMLTIQEWSYEDS